MSRTTKSLPLVLVAVLGLAGCSATSPVDADPTEPGVAAATGETIAGTGYTFTVPEGWGEPEQEIEGFDPDAFAADLDDADGFSDNVNVILSPAGEVTPEQVETLGVQELESVGATDVEVGPRVTVGGSESAHLSAALASEGTEYVVDQFYVTEDGQTYVVTFSFSSTVSDAGRDEIARSVLASWSWS